MTKDDFQACAGTDTQSGDTKKTPPAVVVAFTPPSAGLRPPMPKAPFGMPQMGMAINIKILPPDEPASVTKFIAKGDGDEK